MFHNSKEKSELQDINSKSIPQNSEFISCSSEEMRIVTKRKNSKLFFKFVFIFFSVAEIGFNRILV